MFCSRVYSLSQCEHLPCSHQYSLTTTTTIISRSVPSNGMILYQGTSDNVWRHFWSLRLGRGCYWHPVGREQESFLAICLVYEGSVQFSSVAQSCLSLCDPMNRSTPGLPVHHQLPDFTQTHVHRVGDAIQPSHPLSSPSPPALNPSQDQSLFQ